MGGAFFNGVLEDLGIDEEVLSRFSGHLDHELGVRKLRAG